MRVVEQLTDLDGAPPRFSTSTPTHTLEISKFSLIGPTGPDDWFVQVVDATGDLHLRLR